METPASETAATGVRLSAASRYCPSAAAASLITRRTSIRVNGSRGHQPGGQRRVEEIVKGRNPPVPHLDQVEEIRLCGLAGCGRAKFAMPMHSRPVPLDHHAMDLVVQQLEGIDQLLDRGLLLDPPHRRSRRAHRSERRILIKN